ncbi:hypothetical protein EC957_012304 [Mortierella hygrophila]|uniref:Uncharacterized protein n=1 Tax=Mortierella hygrophila TaxID=979708 RepID=A0A9P6JXC0_9FUNG|nr:hypothetical protein EC957_012304 [Mortierella hygrophila]
MSKSSHTSPAESSTGPSRPPLVPINIGESENRRNGREPSQATTTTPAAATRAAAAPYNVQERSTRRTLRVDVGRTAQPAQWAMPSDETEIRNTAINNDLEDIESSNPTHDRVFTSLQEHTARLDRHIASVLELIQQFEFSVKCGRLFDDFGYLRTNIYTHGPLVGLMTYSTPKK